MYIYLKKKELEKTNKYSIINCIRYKKLIKHSIYNTQYTNVQYVNVVNIGTQTICVNKRHISYIYIWRFSRVKLKI